MFTGIVEEKGIVQSLVLKKNLAVLKIVAKEIIPGLKKGDSVAIDGVCLTVTKKLGRVLSFDLMKETLAKTTLGTLEQGCLVNLERALKAGSRLSGHFVTGHIDEVALVKEVVFLKNYCEYKLLISPNIRKYIVEKGSVCVDGVSLTVGQVFRGGFSVYLIPFTQERTTLGTKQKGSRVNIEVDILAKYLHEGFSGKPDFLKKAFRKINIIR